MGRRNKSYSKDLHQQAYERLNSMQAFGESRRAAKSEGADRDKIFSFNTYKSYWKHTKYFIKYIKEHHSECTTLKKARKYVGEWLQDGVDRGLSAWTIGVQRSAMGKLYGIAPDDEDFFKAPKKQRENIKRSRGVRVRDKHFSKTNNDGLIKFCQGTGLRRKELQELRGKDLMTRAQIEAEISELKKLLPAELTPDAEKRLGMLKDALMFREDYFKILQEKQRAEMDAGIAKSNADKAVTEAEKNAANTVQQARQEAKKEVAAIQGQLEQERAESAHQRALNANLLRIAKERANADRKLKPKKEHTGYVVVASGEKEYRYKDGYRKLQNVLLWEAVIQSPYTIDMPEAIVRKQITRDLLRKNEAGETLIGRLGINGYYPGNYESMVDDHQWCSEPEKYNIALEFYFQMNGRYGYWEVKFFHTRALKRIPNDLRLR